MSWEEKKDFCALAIADKLLVKSATRNRSGTYLEKHGRTGAYAATRLFGIRSTPANAYTVAADFSFTGEQAKKLGAVTTVDGESFALESIKWSTGADQEPTVEASAVQVKTGSKTRNTFAVPELSLSPDQIAQIPLEAFTVSGDGCELTSCSGEISCKVGTNDRNGEPQAHDVTNGHVVINVTIAQYAETEPQITPGEGWRLSSPLSSTDPDSDMPEWTATLSKPLEKTMASETAES